MSNLGKLQEIVIFSSIFSDHNVVRSDINYRRKNRENTNNLEAKQHKIQIYSEFFMKEENSAKVVIDGTYLNIMKAKNCKTTANIIVNNEKLKNISFKIIIKTRMPILIIASFGNSSHTFQRRKRFKKNPHWNRRGKTFSICTWYYALHRKPKRCHQKITGVNQWIE